MFRSLLVPLDGSVFSEHALPFASAIAKRAGAGVQLLHVHVPLVYATGISILDSSTDERAKDQEWAYLDRMVRRWMLAAPEVRMSTVLLEGFPPDVLREQTSKADLVVMATHGRGPASRFWLGSVADALVRTTAVPLLLLRPSEQPPPVALAPPFHHVMVPLDGSDLAEQALGPATQLGRLMETSCTLVRVVKPVETLDSKVRWPAMTGMNEALTRQLLDEARAYLDRIAERLRGQGLAVQTRILLHAHPADAILEETRAQGVDLLALATHGRGGLRRLLLGSVADKVLRGGVTPMLVCRPRTET
ncbi:MAG TPA: universal stress protein [Gemmataceae bacterium]|jgi:nucleotide-binding universal stress UspA family protein